MPVQVSYWGKKDERKSKCLLTDLGASAILSPLLSSASVTNADQLLTTSQVRSAGVALLRGVYMSFQEAAMRIPLHTSLTWENQHPPCLLTHRHQENTQWPLDAGLSSPSNQASWVGEQRDSSPAQLLSVVSTWPTVNFGRVSPQCSFQISHRHWGTSARLLLM